MGKEYEAKFLDIDVAAMKEKLKAIGATQVHKNMKYIRSAFGLCNSDKGYVRVRTEGDNVTMTSKLYTDPKFPEEFEVTIKEDFETGLKFLQSIGTIHKAFQETFREKWAHPDVHEIVFDTIPGLPTYMEIDCTSEDDLNRMVEKLGLDKSRMRFGAFGDTYQEYYGIEPSLINNKTPSLTFNNITKEIFPTKNKELLEKVAKEQQEMLANYLQMSRIKAVNKMMLREKSHKSKSKHHSRKHSKRYSRKHSKRHSRK
jgi:adenylate cyclase class 2